MDMGLLMDLILLSACSYIAGIITHILYQDHKRFRRIHKKMKDSRK